MSLGHIFSDFFYFHFIFIFLSPGHGFKMLVGNVQSQLAVDEKVKYDILPLRLSRISSFKEMKSSQYCYSNTHSLNITMVSINDSSSHWMINLSQLDRISSLVSRQMAF